MTALVEVIINIASFNNQPADDPDGWKVYTPGRIDNLDRAIRDWEPKYNLLVLISLHVGRGSQNGHDHSLPADRRKSHWSQYSENVRNTLDAVEWLIRRYNNDLVFLCFGLLNEPRRTV